MDRNSNRQKDKANSNNTVPKESTYDYEHVKKGDFAKFIREHREGQCC